MIVLRYSFLCLLSVFSCVGVLAQNMKFHNYTSNSIVSIEFLDTINVPVIQPALLSISNMECVYDFSFKKLSKSSIKLFLQIDFISEWHEEMANSRSNYIESEINSTEIELSMSLARYSLSKKYETFLLLAEKKNIDGFLEIKELFMINVRSKRIISIAKIAFSYLLEGDWEQSFSVLYKDNSFLHYTEQISSDVILSKKESANSTKALVSRFRLNNQGIFRVGN